MRHDSLTEIVYMCLSCARVVCFCLLFVYYNHPPSIPPPPHPSANALLFLILHLLDEDENTNYIQQNLYLIFYMLCCFFPFSHCDSSHLNFNTRRWVTLPRNIAYNPYSHSSRLCDSLSFRYSLHSFHSASSFFKEKSLTENRFY